MSSSYNEPEVAGLWALEGLPKAAFPSSTAMFFRLGPGVILKVAVRVDRNLIFRERQSVNEYFCIETRVLQRLGQHPRIVSLLGLHPNGLLLAEARHGSLQQYLQKHGGDLPPALRRKWFAQATEAVAYIHRRGVIHSDLQPANFLVCEPRRGWLTLRLCDFGSSTCDELGLSAEKLPDSGFMSPRLPRQPSFAVDVFSLGSVLYTISTGYWPFRNTTAPFTSAKETEAYEMKADGCFGTEEFPDLDEIFAREIILGCWRGTFSTGGEVMVKVQELELEVSSGNWVAELPTFMD